jgi:NAD(P)-dependent dehydrogenase (short-subunit alcohol dehydrogenase family)
MTQSFADKTILITGGSKGIGLACAQSFLEAGARVAIASRSQQNVDDALKTLPGAIGFAADLTNEEAAAALIGAVEARLGPIDILINSAGAARRTPPADLTPAAYRAAFDAKFFSYINVTDPLIKRMAARRSGVIINIIGAGGKIAATTHIAGGAANAALMLATAGLAQAYAAQNIRVIGISPGLTETSRVAEGMAAEAKLQNITPGEARTRAVAKIPLGRMATPQDIANTALFLASDAASYITGITLTMDGASTASVV